MLLHAVALDAYMTVSQALARLARYGLWLDAQHPEARAWIEKHAKLSKRPFDEVAENLRRNPHRFGAAIRRQYYASILWYSRRADEVLDACYHASPQDTLLQALNLHEPDSRPTIPLPAPGQIPDGEGVVLDGAVPVAVSVPEPARAMAPGPAPAGAAPPPPPPPSAAPQPTGGGLRGVPRSGGSRGAAPRKPPAAASDFKAWPRLDAPNYVPALKPFDVTVGFSASQQAGVSGGRVTIPVPQGATSVDVSIELISDGLDAPDGWRRVLKADPRNPTASQVTFRLVGREPTGPEPAHLTTLEVRYVINGEVCGTASRPLIVGRSTDAAVPVQQGYGTAWLAQPHTATAISVTTEVPAPDLTIELAKPDRNNASGAYVARLFSPHDVGLDGTPFPIDLGDDAKTFAKSVVDQVREYSDDALIDNLLRSIGDLVSEKLPPAFFDALRAVAKKVAPAPPAVLFLSTEPYVPWELARIDPPLDKKSPPYLGAQTVMGRWVREGAGDKPPAQPPASIAVRDMAVMAGMYMADSGLRRLPSAEEEAAALVKSHDAVSLTASSQGLKQLLDAALERDAKKIGGAGAVHFAGHGEYDPSRTDSSVLFLSDGKPLSSLLFRSASYGKEIQPLIFLNACMIGIGGQLLGDMGGFPGNCLRGGFGGVLGALWEVDDVVAAEIAGEFWKRALPTNGKAAEPVAAILRDLRTKYAVKAGEVPIPTYLSYVYYGHPRLTLQRQQ